MTAFIYSAEDAVDRQFGKWLREHRIHVLKLGLVEAAELLMFEVDRLSAIEAGQKAVTKRECMVISGGYNISYKLLIKRAISNF